MNKVILSFILSAIAGGATTSLFIKKKWKAGLSYPLCFAEGFIITKFITRNK